MPLGDVESRVGFLHRRRRRQTTLRLQRAGSSRELAADEETQSIRDLPCSHDEHTAYCCMHC